MAKIETSTNIASDPNAALWRIALSEYERQVAAYAVSAAENTAACEQWYADGQPKGGIDAAERKHDEAVARLYEAREKMLATPAPDAVAMLTKLELLTAYLTECDDEDVHRVRAILDDAKRLFGGR